MPAARWLRAHGEEGGGGGRLRLLLLLGRGLRGAPLLLLRLLPLHLLLQPQQQLRQLVVGELADGEGGGRGGHAADGHRLLCLLLLSHALL